MRFNYIVRSITLRNLKSNTLIDLKLRRILYLIVYLCPRLRRYLYSECVIISRLRCNLTAFDMVVL